MSAHPPCSRSMVSSSRSSRRRSCSGATGSGKSKAKQRKRTRQPGPIREGVSSQPSPSPRGWQCPECGRQIPRSVEVCRCGADRKRLESVGYKFDMAPQAPGSSRAAVAASEAEPGLAGTLVGYRSAPVSRAWHIVFTLLFLILAGGAGYGLVIYTHNPLPPTRQNVEIVTTLEGHTKNAGATGNAIPGFLRLPGTVGVL